MESAKAGISKLQGINRHNALMPHMGIVICVMPKQTEAAKNLITLDSITSRLNSINGSQISHRVDQIGMRSYKKDTQAQGIDLAISCIDLTTLEGGDTPGRIKRLVSKAVNPDREDANCPNVAAICVYPNSVRHVVAGLKEYNNTTIKVAAVASGFPAGMTPLTARLNEIDYSVRSGANEIDTVLDRSLFLSGAFQEVVNRVKEEKEACGKAKLKVILETSELNDLTDIYHSAWLAMLGGADVIKTSTGKHTSGATFPASWVMCLAAKEGSALFSRPIGVKISGGVKVSKDALKHLAIAIDRFGTISPDMWRIGASSLLDDLVAQRAFHRNGIYYGQEYFPVS